MSPDTILFIKVFSAYYIFSMIATIIHELGHYYSGKVMGFKIDEICLGVGPKLYQKTIGGVLVTFKLFIIGGHIALNKSELESEKNKLWEDIKYLKYSLCALSGVLVNIAATVFGMALFYYFKSGYAAIFAFANAVCLLNLLPLPGNDGLLVIAGVVKYIERKICGKTT